MPKTLTTHGCFRHPSRQAVVVIKHHDASYWLCKFCAAAEGLRSGEELLTDDQQERIKLQRERTRKQVELEIRT